MTESIIKAHPEFVSIRGRIDHAIAGLIYISESEKQALLKRMEDLAKYNINMDVLKLYESLPDYPDFLDSHEFSDFKRNVYASEKLLASLSPKANELRYTWLIKLIESEKRVEDLLQEVEQEINLLEEALEGQEKKAEESDYDWYSELEILYEKLCGLSFKNEHLCNNNIRLFNLPELVRLVDRLKSRERYGCFFITQGTTIFFEKSEFQFKKIGVRRHLKTSLNP
ncbi:hypothetical protein H6F75_06490 [Nodosilinea sp. FACHB-131]|uniref:hypothetical protein n=1 Tax=Cyanophyceae TaxID=3028117 RepID=UPI0016820781|nr:hypothetical protein [Nodosilinea sp. FACHB-131]MBD1873123.1 hypothetical protein [Nodosilinea sp. FACHB-131]